MNKNYTITLPDWKQVEIKFSGLHYNTVQKVIDIIWEDMREQRGLGEEVKEQ